MTHQLLGMQGKKLRCFELIFCSCLIFDLMIDKTEYLRSCTRLDSLLKIKKYIRCFPNKLIMNEFETLKKAVTRLNNTVNFLAADHVIGIDLAKRSCNQTNLKIKYYEEKIKNMN
jgi:hypothetical protein